MTTKPTKREAIAAQQKEEAARRRKRRAAHRDAAKKESQNEAAAPSDEIRGEQPLTTSTHQKEIEVQNETTLETLPAVVDPVAVREPPLSDSIKEAVQRVEARKAAAVKRELLARREAQQSLEAAGQAAQLRALAALDAPAPEDFGTALSAAAADEKRLAEESRRRGVTPAELAAVYTAAHERHARRIEADRLGRVFTERQPPKPRGRTPEAWLAAAADERPPAPRAQEKAADAGHADSVSGDAVPLSDTEATESPGVTPPWRPPLVFVHCEEKAQTTAQTDDKECTEMSGQKADSSFAAAEPAADDPGTPENPEQKQFPKEKRAFTLFQAGEVVFLMMLDVGLTALRLGSAIVFAWCVFEAICWGVNRIAGTPAGVAVVDLAQTAGPLKEAVPDADAALAVDALLEARRETLSRALHEAARASNRVLVSSEGVLAAPGAVPTDATGAVVAVLERLREESERQIRLQQEAAASAQTPRRPRNPSLWEHFTAWVARKSAQRRSADKGATNTRETP